MQLCYAFLLTLKRSILISYERWEFIKEKSCKEKKITHKETYETPITTKKIVLKVVFSFFPFKNPTPEFDTEINLVADGDAAAGVGQVGQGHAVLTDLGHIFVIISCFK